jgi:hypothetical protein
MTFLCWETMFLKVFFKTPKPAYWRAWSFARARSPVAGAEGIEPPSTVLETATLPLSYAPKSITP